MTDDKFTPQQLIRYIHLERSGYLNKRMIQDVTPEIVDEVYEDVQDSNEYDYDVMYNLREGDIQTEIAAPSSRNYESYSVAAEAPNGMWVGWTYWYGGGKHGEPEAVEWVEDAYLLNHKEEEKLVVVHSFEKVVND